MQANWPNVLRSVWIKREIQPQTYSADAKQSIDRSNGLQRYQNPPPRLREDYKKAVDALGKGTHIRYGYEDDPIR